MEILSKIPLETLTLLADSTQLKDWCDVRIYREGGKIEGSTHDFSKDPIKHVIEGDWLTAFETSLGADNGIAIAMALAGYLSPLWSVTAWMYCEAVYPRYTFCTIISRSGRCSVSALNHTLKPTLRQTWTWHSRILRSVTRR